MKFAEIKVFAYFALILLLLVGSVLFIGDVLYLFAFSLTISYLLVPIVERLDKFFFGRRWISALTVVMFSCLALFFITALGIPRLVSNLLILTRTISEYVPSLLVKVKDLSLGPLETEILEKISRIASSFLSFVIASISSITSSVTNIISWIIISPLITYYTLRDWEKLKYNTLCLVKPEFREDFSNIISSIDKVLSDYLRGQTRICISLALFYATAFSVIGLKSAIVIGATIGIISYVPYLGTVFAFTGGVIMAAAQFHELYMLFVVIAIVTAGQLLDTIFLTPKLIGKSVSLHPVEVLASILIGNQLFGFIGLIFSIPLLSILKITLPKILSLIWKIQNNCT